MDDSRCQKTEDRCQLAEVRGQKTDYRPKKVWLNRNPKRTRAGRSEIIVLESIDFRTVKT